MLSVSVKMVSAKKIILPVRLKMLPVRPKMLRVKETMLPVSLKMVPVKEKNAVGQTAEAAG